MDEPLEATDPTSVERWTQLAKSHWLKSSKSIRINPQVIKTDIWDVLQNEGFEYRLLLALENLQILEKYLLLFGNFGTATDLEIDKDISGQHTVMIRRITISF